MRQAGRMLVIFALTLTPFLAGCPGESAPVAVRLEDRKPLPSPQTSEPALVVGVGSMITPQDGYGYYRKLLDHIALKMGTRIQAVDPGNYRETNRLLERRKVDVAFVCGGPYVEGHEHFGLELLAAPVVNGTPAYFSYLIVPAGSPDRTFADLRGKTFAFTDPQSNSGRLVPLDLLARMGEKAETFFRSHVFTYAHDRSIRAVAERMVDGAAVDSLVYDYLAAMEPETTAKTRVVARYGPYGIPPVVVHPQLDPAVKTKLKDILLNVHLDAEGRQILEGMRIDRFVEIPDSHYDSIRALRDRSRAPEAPSGP